MKSYAMLVGVVGVSGSGKTTIANSIVKKLREDKHDIAYVRTDHYYKDCSHLTKEAYDQYDFDQPDAMDMDGLFNDLNLLLANKPILRRNYEHSAHSEDEKSEKILPAPVIVVEGIFLLADERIRKLFSLIFLVDTPLDCAVVRRIARDLNTKDGFQRTLKHYETQIRPAAFTNVLNLKEHAHCILTNENKEMTNSSIEKAVTLIKAKITAHQRQDDLFQTTKRYSPLLLGLGMFAFKLWSNTEDQVSVNSLKLS